MSAEDLDGLDKNIDKLKKEFARFTTVMRPHFKRFTSSPDSHSYVNLWVEAHRASPYLTGHLDAILWPLMLAALVVAIFT